jgi:hypothetical protein
MIPDNIKIGGLEYSITTGKDGELSCGGCLAEIRYNDLEIVIKSSLAEGYADKIFLHEVIHGVFHEIGRRDLRDDETLVHAFGNMLYQVLKDNKLTFE